MMETCRKCGTEFCPSESERRNYIHRCRQCQSQISSHRLTSKQCGICSTQFDVRSDKAGRAKYCSRACQMTAARKSRSNQQLTSKFTERFWSKVDRSGGPNACWPWKGRSSNGYGGLNFRKKQWRASRMAYLIANGDFDRTLLVCHTCDNPICVNPAHLWLGTHQQNMADRDAKGRTARGDRHGKRKMARATEDTQCV